MRMDNHEFLTAVIDNSPTRRETVGATINNAPHKAVMYNADGNIVLATDAAKAVGVLLSDTPTTAEKDSEATMLIKNIGLIEAGAAIAKGALLTINSTGQAITATTGAYVFGRAFTAASAAGEIIQIQINPSGKL